jgi:TatD DNase family protein
MFVDSHCHLDMLDNPDAALDRARAAGVGLVLNPGTSRDSFPKILDFAASHDGVLCAFGIHPEANQADIDTAEIMAALENPKVVAIGECGLDYHYKDFDAAAQQRLFEQHIFAAQASGKPLLIHSRDADADMRAMLEKEFARRPFKAVLHCFAGGESLMLAALDMGFYISASGIITYSSAATLRELFARVPLDRLLIETDAPFLAPRPCKADKNEPSFVVETAKKLAEIKGVTPAEIERATAENFRKVVDLAPA